MYARNSITALVVIATLALHSGCQAQTPCTTDGWFGPNCQYQCHCAGSGPCDKHDGSCSSGCHQDWFGPACQYDRLGYSGPGWLTDNDDTTCNTGNIQPVTVTLDTPIPLTWVRVVVRNAGSLNQIQLSYQLSGSPGPQTCPGPRKAEVNDLTLDIDCSTTESVSGVTLSGSGVTGLCSLYISGGRNVALKQRALQSSKFESSSTRWNAGYAVDGTTGGNSPSTCTHTEPNSASPGWWEVTFSQAVDVTRFLIFNRDSCCKERLIGFTMTAQSDPSRATPYSYTDPGGPGQDSYTVVPSPRISFPVSQVRFVTADSQKILTLCEVFVFGETNCPAGQFGLGCERQCNCANNGNCFVHSGGCPSGCAIGYTGEDCSEQLPECEAGRYGADCSLSCSATCGGDNSCDRADGACSQGCDPGYIGRFCATQCPTGRYGSGCLQSCSSNCRGADDACNHIDGKGINGCEDGYQGDMCGAICGLRTYGAGCVQICSVTCAGSNNACNHVTGNCDEGCDTGYWGNKCWKHCSTGCAGQTNACNDVNGACNEGCDPGYVGEQCVQVCEVGKYGAGCTGTCAVHCAGSGNPCNHITGHCDNGCDPGYHGINCTEECDPGTYGAGCLQTCSVNCAGPDNACNHVTGICDVGCEPGYWTDRCLLSCRSECGGPNKDCSRADGACVICPPGYYGTYCLYPCSRSCGGPDNICDQISGSCTAGCDPGYYGDKCLKTCSKSCGGPDNACNRASGVCDSCKPGFRGGFCSRLCSSKCGGPDNACDQVTGACNSCPPGFTAASCDQKCPSGSYGKECAETCSEHCAGDQNSCHHVNGTCDLGCDPGYQGSSCTQVCPRNRYGAGCNQACSIQCPGPDGPCHYVDGSCYFGHNGLEQREKAEGCGLNIWGITMTCVAALAISVIAVLVWRLWKNSRDEDYRSDISKREGGMDQNHGNEPSSRGTQSADSVGITDHPAHSYMNPSQFENAPNGSGENGGPQTAPDNPSVDDNSQTEVKCI